MMYAITLLIGVCIGIIVMAIIADRTNKAETENLRQQIDRDSRNYLRCVSKMQDDIDELSEVLEAYKTENAELQRCLDGKPANRKGGNDEQPE